MKKLFFLLLFIPFGSSAQIDKEEDLLLKFNADTSLGRLVKLPQLKRGELNKYFEIGRKSKYGYTVSEDSIYRKIFAAYHKDSLPVIDFTKEELLLHVYCPHCLVNCRHSRLDYPCHRNACSYSNAWFIRDKKL